jgi:hypothetical protein
MIDKKLTELHKRMRRRSLEQRFQTIRDSMLHPAKLEFVSISPQL